MVSPGNLGPIRPPSEAYSLLIRATINCPWNRCRFCRTYKGAKFQLRPVAEIVADVKGARAISDRIKEFGWRAGYGGGAREAAAAVLSRPLTQVFYNVALWMYAGAENVFLQDADSLIMRTGELAEVLRSIRQTFPDVKRVTSYARSKTVARKKAEELAELRQAGLTRIHIGLETGYDALLEYVDKGVTAADHIKGGRNVKAAGLELSEYVILGLGGKKMWREHATETARVLNAIEPDFIRMRTLNITNDMPMCADVDSGAFVRLTDEEIVAEERLLIENLECHSNFVSDHVSDLLMEVEGRLPEDKPKMLAVFDRYQALSADEKVNFQLGRRSGLYQRLDQMSDTDKHDRAEGIRARLERDRRDPEDAIHEFMAGFI